MITAVVVLCAWGAVSAVVIVSLCIAAGRFEKK